jgi:hypothetical protein
MTRLKLCPLLALLLCFGFSGNPVRSDSYKYFRQGNKEDVQTQPMAGIAMMGGGSDLDEAFRWLCRKGNGGAWFCARMRCRIGSAQTAWQS